MHSLLDDPLIGIRSKDGDRRLSLPELLAALSAGNIEGYTGLRPHQADPWHVFLVQLAASIQARQPTKTLPADADYWRDGLLELADGKATAWELVVEDVTQPAFMQHPWRSWEEDADSYGVKTVRGKTVYDAKASAPDELDVLVTSKNHDVKMARVSTSEIEAWIYALMTLQTTSGFLGAGNYGIVRMNGGFASRPIVSWSVSRHPGARFTSEVRALCDMRNEVANTYRYKNRGVVLTWTSPWDRSQHQFLLTDLEPWFCESARPVRLMQNGGNLIALTATSKTRQIGPKTLENGDVGDPWIPIHIKKQGRAAMTLNGEGFTPEILTGLIFQSGYELTPIQHPTQGEGDGWLLCSCFVRGQGKTDGFHRVEIPVPAKAKMALLSRTSRDTLGGLAKQMLNSAGKVRSALSTALTILAEGGTERPNFERIKNWLKANSAAFARGWKTDYFPILWRGVDEPHDIVLGEWNKRLVDIGQKVFDESIQRIPISSNRAWRAITRSERVWRRMLRKAHLLEPRLDHPQALEEIDT